VKYKEEKYMATQPAVAKIDRATEIKNRMVRYFNEAVNQGKVSLVDEMFNPDYTFNGQPFPREANKQWILKLRAALPDVHFSVEAMLAEDNLVAFRWKLTGTDAQGHKQELTGTNIVTMDDQNMALSNMQNGHRTQTETFTDSLIYAPFG
jgi:predicted ester cyclase